jgi:hypothetical protein
MKTQRFPIGTDIKSETLQRNLEDLFYYSHTHDVKTSIPVNSEGNIGDLVPVVIGTDYYLYVKFPSVGWKRVTLI